MTTKEALEIWKQHGTTKSACYLADAYLAEHDDTPLTLELAKEVLGEPDGDAFTINGNYAGFWSHAKQCVFLSGHLITTIGQLRTLARLLRGGV